MIPKSVGANIVVEQRLTAMLMGLEEAFGADVLVFVGPIAFGADDDIRNGIETLPERNPNKKLLFILETPGGFAEVARRISDTARFHYQTVDFLVPSYAMSAGTILVMSGDAIWMDYYSTLGPIDPQVEGKDGRLIPALGYLLRYEELLKKANQGQISTAEMAVLLNFDQGQLYSYEQARDLSRTLLEEWLVKYKFKDWTVTETRKLPVTPQMKKRCARKIAQKLNDVKRWNSHGIGINRERLESILNLKIDDFSKDPARNTLVREYHQLLTDYMGKMRMQAAVHMRHVLTPLATGG